MLPCRIAKSQADINDILYIHVDRDAAAAQDLKKLRHLKSQYAARAGSPAPYTGHNCIPHYKLEACIM